MLAKLRSVRPEHLIMLLRGMIWQVLHFRFGAIVLMDRGAQIRLDRRVRLTGLIKLGRHSRMDLRFTAAGNVGPGFSLGDFSIFRASGSSSFTCPRVEVAENVSFGPYCNIGGGFGLSIGADVIGGPYVSIHPEEHGLDPDVPIRAQPVQGTGIAIERDCWLGAKSTILDGSHLEEGTVLAAGAVLTGTRTERMSLYAGLPAKRVRTRHPDGGCS
ncbi:acyltransferase [Tropicimonas sp. TH_r6]|uniref:acyltransferase n=1 Tax=Tropicimonas sp. TH_r6 TaxID=3082085 RepID=UPI00295394D5|nr:acyltransferase [Tropicimonas sp. TH_r6]MDV7144371.1 acyltransferase [Tropicimonas sp. TH_r6]